MQTGYSSTCSIKQDYKVKMSDPTEIFTAAWAICSIKDTILGSSPGAAVFGKVMLFDAQYLRGCKAKGEVPTVDK